MAVGSGSVESDDAMCVWKVVKLSRPLTNAPLMKTVGAMTGMRRKMVEATCMFGPHACGRAAWGVLVEMGMEKVVIFARLPCTRVDELEVLVERSSYN